MKKVLLSTSAIALAGAFATTANAADWNVRVGGYYNAMVAYAQTDNTGTADFDGVDVSTNAEVFFLPSITLDNGIKIGANIQLEGEQSGDQIDESYVYVKGSFGEVLIGSENSAGYKMHYGAPNAAIISLNSPSTGDYIAWSGGVDSVFRGTLGATYLEVARNNDAKRITYFTPRFSGFQLGVSYAHDGAQDNFGPTNIGAQPVPPAPTAGGTTFAVGNVAHIFDIGANYVQSFGDFNVALSGRYGVGQQDVVVNAGGGAVATFGNTPTIWSVGLNLGYGGFTIGGSFAESNEHDGGANDGTAYDVGVSYGTGPWTFSLTYFHGENSSLVGLGPNGNEVTAATTLGVDKQDTFGVGVNYALAKGVKLNAFGAYVDLDAAAGPAADRDGFVIGTGIGLSW